MEKPCRRPFCPVIISLVIVLANCVGSANAEIPGPSGTGLSAANTLLSVPPATEGMSRVIGDIQISNGSIFDLDDPAEDKALYRLANRAHPTTRPQVIQQQLLFRTGDSFDLQAIEESERILRSNRYLQDVSIKTVKRDDGAVDVDVITTDTWTLMPKISLSRSGGTNKSTLGLKEQNLLGTGISIEALYKSDVDRDYRLLKIMDNHLGRSWVRLTGVLANNSDGHTRSLAIEKPFYSLQSTGALGFSFLDNDEADFFYDQGREIGRYRHEAKQFEMFAGWSKGLRDGWARRYLFGVALDEHRFSTIDETTDEIVMLPGDRRFSYPFVGIELVQDRFQKGSNHEQINRTEDIFTGTRLQARLGLAGSGAASNGNTWILNASAETGFGDVDQSLLLLASSLTTRFEPDGLRNLLVSATANYFKRQSEHRLLYAALDLSYGNNLDLDQFLLLGGDSGLRGYPLRYQSGDRRALLTIEQRFFTNWYPWRLFYVGSAVFLDIGRAWGDAAVARSDDRLLKNVGAGLRIGSSRSGFGRMTHIDIAMPLDGGDGIKDLQFLVSTKKGF